MLFSGGSFQFILENTIVVIKDVPAEVCASCHESYTTGNVTDHVVALLQPLRALQTEISVISYTPTPTPQLHKQAAF
jgi:YgiT-type zinc finger domain-containing protein